MEKNVKMIPRWWKLVPFLGTEVATTIYPNIYLPRAMYENLSSSEPGVPETAVLLHEKTHIERQKKAGVFLWHIKYIFSRSFRLHEELAGIKVEMNHLKENGRMYNFHRKALQFSSGMYLWVLPYEKSMNVLKELWEI